jgi:hypothetical protein
MPQLPDVSDPATFIDGQGKILLWYLPDIVLDRVVSTQSGVPYVYTTYHRARASLESQRNTSTICCQKPLSIRSLIPLPPGVLMQRTLFPLKADLNLSQEHWTLPVAGFRLVTRYAWSILWQYKMLNGQH